MHLLWYWVAIGLPSPLCDSAPFFAFFLVCVDIGETAVFIDTPHASMITSVGWCVKYCHMLTTTIFPSKPGLSDRLVRVVNGSTIPGSLEYCTRSSLCSSHAYPGVFYLTQALPRLMWLFVSGYLVNAATFVSGSLIRDSPSRQPLHTVTDAVK